MRIPMTDLRFQHDSIRGEVDAAIRGVIESGQFILGPEVQAFEEEMAAYCGTRYAIGVASGTDALLLALLACGIGPGDEVITTPFTFIATVESIVKCGARPVFVDIDPRTYNLDAAQVPGKVTPRTRALLPVHLYGQPAALGPVMEVAARHHLKVIEDCAQAVGATYDGKKVGSVGDAGCLSFFPAKNLGAYGDGGMVITSDRDIADRVRLLRGHGAKTTYFHTAHGFNSRLDALQAAILRVKLKHLDHWNTMRRANTRLYNELLRTVEGIEPMFFADRGESSCNYYTVRLTATRLDRQELRAHLDGRGIQTNVYYPLSLHLQEVYQDLGYHPGDLPHSELAQREVLSLPMYPELSDEEIRAVVAAIAEFLRR
jgi:dTDP-4-amino-4,6-dideoxygalactose transaminase